MTKLWGSYGKRFVAVAVAAAMVSVSVGTPRVQAMMAPTHTAVAAAAMDRNADVQKIQTALENKMIQHRLAQVGLTPDQVQQRVANLSDEKIHQLAQQIDKQMPAADSSDTAITVLIAVAVVALILWLWDHL